MIDISLLPLGQIEPKVLKFLKKILEEKFDCSIETKKPLGVPQHAYDAKRKQYNSTKILAFLREKSFEKAAKELALTDADLYADRLDFVFGEAEVKGKEAIISLHRLYPQFYELESNEAILEERVAKEAIHELGHTFGLSHCAISACVMYFSNSIIDTDLKEKNFCSDCYNKLKAEIEREEKCLG